MALPVMNELAGFPLQKPQVCGHCVVVEGKQTQNLIIINVSALRKLQLVQWAANHLLPIASVWQYCNLQHTISDHYGLRHDQGVALLSKFCCIFLDSDAVLSHGVGRTGHQRPQAEDFELRLHIHPVMHLQIREK